MAETKAEWERLLDDSFQWHVAHRIMFVIALLICGAAPWIGWRYLWLLLVVVPFYWGFTIRENYMISKAQHLRKEEP